MLVPLVLIFLISNIISNIDQLCYAMSKKVLMLSMLGKKFQQTFWKKLFLSLPENRIWHFLIGLIFSMMGKIIIIIIKKKIQQTFWFFFYFPKAICMKCLILFSGKIKKMITQLVVCQICPVGASAEEVYNEDPDWSVQPQSDQIYCL